jgi:hypothetical protein
VGVEVDDVTVDRHPDGELVAALGAEVLAEGVGGIEVALSRQQLAASREEPACRG